MYVRVEEAARPELNPKFLSEEKPDKVRKTVIRVGDTLLYDIHLFRIFGFLEDEARDTIYFVRGAHFYGEVLLSSPAYMSGLLCDGTKEPSDLQNEVRGVLEKVRKGLEDLDKAIVEAGWKLDVATLHRAPLVPTASPYQLLIEALFNRGEVAAALSLSRDDKDLIRNIKSHLPQQLILKPPGPKGNWRRERIGNGRPLTTFLSIYRMKIGIWVFHREIGKRFLVGCSKPNVKGFKAFNALVMRLRKKRVRKIIPLCDNAVNALKAREKLYMARSKNDNKTNEERLDEARMAAWADMKHHASFLGGTDEVGAAFNESWQIKPACYTCDSTTGYQEPTPTTYDNRQTVFRAFK